MPDKEAILLMGLPLAGKTTWMQSKDLSNFLVVSADTIKESHPEYNPEEAYKLHNYSVKEAKRLMGHYSDIGSNIVMDGGGINRKYTRSIIDMLHNKNYWVKLVHIKTPLLVCLDRNKERIRKVPEDVIIDKAMRENASFHELKEIVDIYEVVDYFTHEHIFIDMDGVLAAQTTLPIINGELDAVNGSIHKYQEPVTQVIDKFRELHDKGKTLYILSATLNSICHQEKLDWLEEHVPFIPNDRVFFVNRGRHKAEMLSNLVYKFKLQKHQVTLVDDTHQTLYDTLNRRMKPMHVSEFLTFKF